jgi:hypothetical protein
VGFLYIVLGSIVVFLYSSLWYLTSGIRALSSATKRGNFFSLFLQIFFQEEKEGRNTLDKSCSFCVEFVETGCISEFLSEKNQFQKKKNRLKQSLGSEVIIILKSVNFQGFSTDDRTILLIFVAPGAKFPKKNYISEFLFQKYPISKKKSSESESSEVKISLI